MNQLVSASEADADLGFMARLLALCSLPRTNPGNRHQYKRVNGPFRLYMQAGPETKLPFGFDLGTGESSPYALRYGSLGFGREASRYSQARLRNQMERLFS